MSEIFIIFTGITFEKSIDNICGIEFLQIQRQRKFLKEMEND